MNTLCLSPDATTATLHLLNGEPVTVDLRKPAYTQDLIGHEDDKFYVVDQGVRFPQFASVELNLWQEDGIYTAIAYCFNDDIETRHDVSLTDREMYLTVTHEALTFSDHD